MDIRYLALGDSYTIGESVKEEDRFPNQLAALLEKDGLQVGVTIIARTGWTTDELWQGIQAATVTPPYDLVSLLIGVNNQYRNRSIDEYRTDFSFLLNKAIEYAGGDANRVIVFSIPDWGVTPFARDRERMTGNDLSNVDDQIDAFNQVNFEISQSAGVHYVNVTPISRQAVDKPSLIAGDGLHPSGEMYAEWVKLAYPIALEILK
ncbi:MAG: SGNH/GDSL hydrolase family protein [Anaerolineae bacterium]|nr:SGNH/GDSL hydrolase family protein [Anaerolineae bacterium]